VNRAIELWDEAGRNPARYVELLKKHGVLRFGRLPVVPDEPQWSPYRDGRSSSEVAS
jgi:hypothetical protein